MNSNSLICRLIDENKNWREILENKTIKIKTNGSLAIFNYGNDPDFSDPLVQEARGIIIDLESLEVVCWPFRKFCNREESCADTIDWKSARVQEKIDGSIIKLWYNRRIGFWQFSTSSCIDAADAEVFPGLSFLDLISQTEEYRRLLIFISINELNPDLTYIFELVSPDAKQVVKYDKTKLYVTGARNNKTGIEIRACDALPTFDRPREFPLGTLDQCIEAAKELNKGKRTVEAEGFVVVDDDWHRIKVKSPEFVLMHRISDNRAFSVKRIIPAVRAGVTTFDGIAETFPESEHIIRWYQWQMAELLHNAKEACLAADRYSAEFSGDRKAVALAVKDTPCAWAAFRHLKSGESAEIILKELTDAQYIKNLKPYGEKP